MPSIFVTRKIPQPGLDLLKEHEMELNPDDRVLSKQEVIAGVKGKDAMLCLLTDTIDAAVMDAAGKNLKIIANYAVGYNNIDVAAATERKIMVSNTPGVLTETTADLAWSLLMCAARRIVEGDKFTRAGKFVGWAPMMLLGSDVYGKTLGIVGLGRIGQAVAKRARGFDMKVIYTDLQQAPSEVEKEANVDFVDLETLLKESDYVSIHVPLSEETKYMIGARELEMMKDTAYLINTARGPIVNEKELVEALKADKIKGAALDVYEEEPKLAPGLVELENVVIPPHLGSATLETRTKMAEMAAGNIVAFFKGERPLNIVNPEALK